MRPRSSVSIAALPSALPANFSGRIPKIPANLVLVKNLTIIGLYWGYYMAWGAAKASDPMRGKVRLLFKQLFSLFEQGALNPPVDSTLPLADFAGAMRRVEERQAIGKVVLKPGR